MYTVFCNTNFFYLGCGCLLEKKKKKKDFTEFGYALVDTTLMIVGHCMQIIIATNSATMNRHLCDLDRNRDQVPIFTSYVNLAYQSDSLAQCPCCFVPYAGKAQLQLTCSDSVAAVEVVAPDGDAALNSTNLTGKCISINWVDRFGPPTKVC